MGQSSDPFRPPQLRLWPWLAAVALITVVGFLGVLSLSRHGDRVRNAVAETRVLEASISTALSLSEDIDLSSPSADERLAAMLRLAPATQAHLRRLTELDGSAPVAPVSDVLRRFAAFAMEPPTDPRLGRASTVALRRALHSATASLSETLRARLASVQRQTLISQLSVLLATLLLVLAVLHRARRLLDTTSGDYARRLEHMAHHDGLTGLPNRRRLDHDAACWSGATVQVALCDLDGFKHCNDTHGHATGDDVLVDTARAMADELGAAGQAYRLGGDEFCVMISSPDADLARRLQSAVNRQIADRGVTVSVGIATVPTDAPDVSRALRVADQRMYAAKRMRLAAA